MKLFNRDTSTDICVIAEVGVNHSGNLSWIMDLLPQLKDSGVDAVKFQVFTPEKYIVKSNVDRFNFLTKRTISRNHFLEILEFADRLNLPVFATPLTEDWVPFLVEHCTTVKVASGDFNFLPTLSPLLESQVNLILSTGAVSKEELVDFVSLALEIRGERRMRDTVALLHCISSYPPPLSEANLNAITHIKSLTGLVVGFSSHFLTDSPIFCALALGARIFEIHVTDDRARDDVRDHQLSRTPSELSELVSQLRQLNSALYSKEKEVQPSEIGNLPLMRKGLVSTIDISKGEEFSVRNVGFARPQTDLTSSDFKLVLNNKAAVFIPAHTSLHRHHLQV
jgi:N,N'-diacetyllegionaminate synthase